MGVGVRTNFFFQFATIYGYAFIRVFYCTYYMAIIIILSIWLPRRKQQRYTGKYKSLLVNVSILTIISHYYIIMIMYNDTITF